MPVSKPISRSSSCCSRRSRRPASSASASTSGTPRSCARSSLPIHADSCASNASIRCCRPKRGTGSRHWAAELAPATCDALLALNDLHGGIETLAGRARAVARTCRASARRSTCWSASPARWIRGHRLDRPRRPARLPLSQRHDVRGLLRRPAQCHRAGRPLRRGRPRVRARATGDGLQPGPARAGPGGDRDRDVLAPIVAPWADDDFALRAAIATLRANGEAGRPDDSSSEDMDAVADRILAVCATARGWSSIARRRTIQLPHHSPNEGWHIHEQERRRHRNPMGRRRQGQGRRLADRPRSTPSCVSRAATTRVTR